MGTNWGDEPFELIPYHTYTYSLETKSVEVADPQPPAHKPTSEIFESHRPVAIVWSLGLILAGVIGLGYNVYTRWPHTASARMMGACLEMDARGKIAYNGKCGPSPGVIIVNTPGPQATPILCAVAGSYPYTIECPTSPR